MDGRSLLTALSSSGGDLAAVTAHLVTFRCHLSNRAVRGVAISKDEDATTDNKTVTDIVDLLSGSLLSPVTKWHLLILLQSNTTRFVTSKRGLNNLVASLFNLLRSNLSISGQLFISITYIMIEFDLVTEEKDLSSRVISKLLELSGLINNETNLCLRHCTLQCLVALETQYPGLFQKKLDHYYYFCSVEKSCISESYFTFFSLLLSHVFVAALKQGAWSDEYLTMRNEALEACSLVLIQPIRKDLLYTSAHTHKLTGLIGSELKNSLTLLASCLDNCSTQSFSQIAARVAFIISSCSDFDCSLLRTSFLKCLNTNSVTILSSLYYLYSVFGKSLFQGSTSSEGALMEGLTRVMANLTYPIPVRLLMSLFALTFPLPIDQFDSDTLPSKRNLSVNLIKTVFPTIFDPLDLRVQKIALLNLCFVPTDNSDEASACLMSSMASLRRPAVQAACGGRLAAAFFRALFVLYRRHRESVLAEDVRRMLVDMVNSNLVFTEHTLDFLDAVSVVFPDSVLVHSTYSELCDLVAVQSSEQMRHEDALVKYMTILNRAACDPKIQPQPIVDFLSQLLKNLRCGIKNYWTCGSLILDVCCSILQYHANSDLTQSFENLCEVVAWLSLNYPDVDVRTRAQLYYSLITQLTYDRLQDVFFHSSLLQGRSVTLSVTNQALTVPPLRKLSSPVLQLENTHQTTLLSSKTLQEVAPLPLSCYKTDLTLLNFTVELKLQLQILHCKELMDEEVVLGVDIDFFSQEKDVDSIHVPHLPLRTGHEVTASVRVACTQIGPGNVLPRVVFTTPRQGQFWDSVCEPVQLILSDFMFPCLCEDPLALFHTLEASHGHKAFVTAAENSSLDFLHQSLAPFQVSQHCYLIFLPPTSHVTLTVQPGADRPHKLLFSTEQASLLPHVHMFLLSLIPKS